MKKTIKGGAAAKPATPAVEPVSEMKYMLNPLYIMSQTDVNEIGIARVRLGTARSALRGINFLLKCCHPDVPPMYADQWRALLDPIVDEVENALDQITHLKLGMRFSMPTHMKPLD